MEKEGKNKIIHYCWFGDHKLSRLAKKCIKSWQKYLPDYKIICWNEDNVNLDECPFVKEAYKKKKWAFVADYVRAKAIYEYGGIYLDTDMKITKNIDDLIKKGDFIGVEDSGAVAVGVWSACKPKSDLASELLDFYRSQTSFNDKNLYAIAIPVLVTRILSKYGFKKNETSVQKLSNGMYVYPRDYFYPLSYNYHNNAYSENTCMVHYYDASWASREERWTIWQIRKFGPKKVEICHKVLGKFKALIIYYAKVLKRTLQVIIYPFRWVYKKLFCDTRKKFSSAVSDIKKTKKSYIVFVKEGWLGVGSSTKNMFSEVVYIPDIERGDDYSELIKSIVDNKKLKMIIFSGFADGWENIIDGLREKTPELKIKVFWHGSNAMHIEEFDWKRFNMIMSLLKDGKITEVAFAKKSMYEQYKKLGYNVAFLPNSYSSDVKIKKEEEKDNYNRIGVYFSGDRWVKNFYNQIAAASLIKNAKVDIVPISPRVADFAKLLNLDLTGEENTVPREQLLERIAKQDVVLYATFVECAPILPLECLELGVPCVTGDNHHYWAGTELEEYLVEPKVDNPIAIAKRAEKCIKNKEKIIKLYKEWKKEYDKDCSKAVKKFLSD